PHVLLLRRQPQDLGLHADGSAAHREMATQGKTPSMNVGDAVRHASFRWLTVAFWLATIATAALSIHLLPYLRDRGYDPTFAAAVTGSLGAVQVLARLVVAPFGSRVSAHLLAGL